MKHQTPSKPANDSTTGRGEVDVQCLVRRDVFGWFDSPSQKTPSHDPKPNGICPVCTKVTGKHTSLNPLVTISLAIQDLKQRNKSYFFRAHKKCWANTKDKNLIESSLIDLISQNTTK